MKFFKYNKRSAPILLVKDRIGRVVGNNLCLLINTSKLVRPNTTDVRKLVQQVTLVISVTPSRNATDTRKLVKRVALLISVTPS